MSKNKQNTVKTTLRQKLILITLGFLLTLAILEAGLRLAGFMLASFQEQRNKVSIRQKGAYRIMCLGESTTAGQYPLFLEEILNSRNIGIKFSVIDKGIVGVKTMAIVEQLEANLDKYRPDMVITMMGINDEEPQMLYKGIFYSKVTNFLKSFRTYKLTKLLRQHMISKLRELRLTKIKSYLELAWFYQDQGKSPEVEATLKKIIELYPGDIRGYFELAWLYRNQGKFPEAEAL
ncbi:MAG TPA: tetratricopeptide repeat protein, partial [Candidatus Margulisiibacteriota bacterium]|nr:tetratricopeptide repeat protein [Candidatus Margulisiibacteriota bacterium]